MSSWSSAYLEAIKELDATQCKLRKADHDRQRYAKRIQFLQARHEIILRELAATRKELYITKTALIACERELFDGNI